MKLWILKNKDSLPLKLERYPQAARQVDFEVEIVDVDAISAVNADGDFSLIKEGIQLLRQDYPQVIIVVCRTFGHYHMQMWGAELVQHFQEAGVVVGNDYHSRSLADHKWLTHQRLVVAGVETPKTWLISREADQSKLIESQTYPLVLKTAFGHKGDGVYLCQSSTELEKNMEQIDERKTLIIQEYLPATHGKDVRAFVVGDEVVAVMKRSAASDSFKANLGADGTGEIFELTEDQKQMAIKATQSLGLHYSGVDLLFKSDTELVVGEVNANPGLEGIEKVSGVDVAQKICQYLKQVATTQK